MINHIDGFVQDCSISSANALEILQSCSKPLIYYLLSVTANLPAGIFLSPAVANLDRWSSGWVIHCWAHLSWEHVSSITHCLREFPAQFKHIWYRGGLKPTISFLYGEQCIVGQRLRRFTKKPKILTLLWSTLLHPCTIIMADLLTPVLLSLSL